MEGPVGYIFGYGSLVGTGDSRVTQLAARGEIVAGHLDGFRRAWNAAMENRAPFNDDAYYVDSRSGERPDIYVVALNVYEVAGGRVNGVAVPADTQRLPMFDRRELHYDRIDVSDRFVPSLDKPVWTYAANTLARKDYKSGQAAGRAFISRQYFTKIEAIFRELENGPRREFLMSTDPPRCPLRELVHIVDGQHVT